MKICPKCNDTHNKAGIYCCRSCANSRMWSQTQRDKKSATLSATLEQKDTEYFKNRASKGAALRSSTIIKQLLETEFSKLGHHARRRRVLIEQENKCNKCGLINWLDNPISLELEHIDGNNKNNDRDNLECLCPNCHAQTPTWRGRNRTSPV